MRQEDTESLLKFVLGGKVKEKKCLDSFLSVIENNQ